ncbi:uncharacterized protein [Lolium perenne]|uniref:uncharacterized protein n=1 Tax=Lolium perenne TaxID=4522 RepID=UPI0021EA531B|nr:uncharacterized protein LOC127295599 [Lolium perenne]
MLGWNEDALACGSTENISLANRQLWCPANLPLSWYDAAVPLSSSFHPHSRRRCPHLDEKRSEAMPRAPVAERPRLTLEDYVLFFATHSGNGLTIHLLNQILFMHGFIKFHNSKKPVIVDALNSLALLRPRRSTVSINAAGPPPRAAASSSAAELSAEDVRRDIEALGWRACPVGSVLAVRAGAAPAPVHVPLATMPPPAFQRVSPTSVLGASPLLSTSPPAAPAAPGKRKHWTPQCRGRTAVRQREKRIVELLTLPSVEDLSSSEEGQGGGAVASAIA